MIRIVKGVLQLITNSPRNHGFEDETYPGTITYNRMHWDMESLRGGGSLCRAPWGPDAVERSSEGLVSRSWITRVDELRSIILVLRVGVPLCPPAESLALGQMYFPLDPCRASGVGHRGQVFSFGAG